MVRSLEQIEKELAALEKTSKILADELYQVFLSYIKSLGKAVQNQLILASYHLCTQGYPENFLALSLKEKQVLQSAIRQVANMAVQELLIWLPLSLKVEQNLQNKSAKTSDSSASTALNDETDEDDESGAENDKIYAVNLGMESEDTTHLASTVLTNPIQIYRWSQKLEQGILDVLQTVSRTTNSQMQKHKILPKNLPDILLDVAGKSSRYMEPIGNAPNLLNLKIEVGSDSESQQSSNPEVSDTIPKEPINLLTVHLRLSDIEFADPAVMGRRNQIRQILHRLSGLKQEYQKKQQERTIAEAEAAWRSSWIED